MHVLESNKHMATEEVMAAVAKLHQMIEQHKTLTEEIREFARENDFWHFELDWNDVSEVNVLDVHERWLASNHNC